MGAPRAGSASPRRTAAPQRAPEHAAGAQAGRRPPHPRRATEPSPRPSSGAQQRAPADGRRRPTPMDDEVRRRPDIAENDGVAQTPQKRPAKSRTRNRRHGRRR